MLGLVRADGTLANAYEYGPWGEALAVNEAVAQPLRYAARELDPVTGLYYVRARWYDPHQGRFVSEDPIGLAGGINPYAYAGNDPINYTDPSGLCRVVRISTYDITWVNGVEVSRNKISERYVVVCDEDKDGEGGAGGDKDPGDEPPSERERKRLECVSAGHLSRQARSVFDQALSDRRVLMGRRNTGTAIAYADWSTPPNIIFAPGRFGPVQSFSSHQLAEKSRSHQEWLRHNKVMSCADRGYRKDAKRAALWGLGGAVFGGIVGLIGGPPGAAAGSAVSAKGAALAGGAAVAWSSVETYGNALMACDAATPPVQSP